MCEAVNFPNQFLFETERSFHRRISWFSLITWVSFITTKMSKTMCKNENNRGKIQIMADIVDLCKAGIRKTHIMYRGNLSYDQINRYLYELLEKELIIQNIDDGVLTYRATEKGRSFLQYYNLMLSILDENVIGMESPISKLA